MKEKFLPKGVIQACFTAISLTYHLFWENRKENKYKLEKHHIYKTMTPIYKSLIVKKKTHSQQYYLKTVQLNKENSN